MRETTSAVQDYLKTIHGLGGSERTVSPAEIADALDVRAPSVSEMLRRLAEQGWITYELRRGAQLTAEGVAQARRVIRRHRLVELFLTQVLGLDWSEVDAEAELLEHAISPRLEEAIAAYLGEPREDPHGHPIPSAAGHLQARDLQPLHRFAAGAQVVIREVRDDDPDRLKRWRTQGLVPGAVVRFVSVEPLDDLFRLDVGGSLLQVGSEGLAGLLGEPAPWSTTSP